MRNPQGNCRWAAMMVPAISMMLAAAIAAPAQQFAVLYNFSGTSGEGPNGLIADSTGNLYGTTAGGGDLNACSGNGCGNVFELPAAGFYTVLHNFTGGAGGLNPDLAPSFRNEAGYLYGSTPFGGQANSACITGTCGVIFNASPTGKEKVLYSFTGGSDGSYPSSILIHDSAGNVYGLAAHGGNFSGPCSPYGCGVVFKLTKSGQETVLYTFSGGLDGSQPGPGLVRDSAGNLYGTTGGGGAYNWGVIFKLDPSGNETVLYSF